MEENNMQSAVEWHAEESGREWRDEGKQCVGERKGGRQCKANISKQEHGNKQ